MIRILPGNCLDVLPTLEAGSVQCVVTSPPYFGLRSYLPTGHADKVLEIGSELSPDAYVAQLVAVFAAVRRVLADTGVVFLNLGDSYAAGKSGRSDAGRPQKGNGWAEYDMGPVVQRRAPEGFKPKDLLMIPARVALALQADGWWLRSDIIWHKPNPMPESVTDRPTSAHEHVFMLSKKARYFYDMDAVREVGSGRIPGNRQPLANRGCAIETGSEGSGFFALNQKPQKIRNIRNVWTIATQPYPGGHFATMPPKLAERCIKAGSRSGDTVLDPFSGAGTTALVANRLGRHAIGIELNDDYCAMARQRVSVDAGLFGEVVAA